MFRNGGRGQALALRPRLAVTLAARSNLSVRLLTAAIGLPLLMVVVWAGGIVLIGLVAIVALAAAWEFGKIATGAGVRLGRPIIAALWLLGGALYIGLPLRYFIELRVLPDGAAWVFLALLTTFANDTAAYAIGRAAGRHRMAPGISPGKTWEGAAGGLVAAVVACPLLAMLLGLPEGQWVLLGCGIALAAQAGDLLESMLKRWAGVKDASALVPGHGGVLDRLDSLVLVAPLVYHYSQWLT